MICFEESEAKYYREHQCQNFLSLPPIAHNKTQSLYTFISDSKAPSISDTYFYVLLLCSFPYFWQIEWIYFIGLQIFFTLSITYLMWPAAIITRQKKKVWIHVAIATATEKYPCFYKYSLKRFNFSKSVGKEAYFRGKFHPLTHSITFQMKLEN